MSRHNRERRSFRKAKAKPFARQSNPYETTRLLKHGKKKLAGKAWTK